MKKIIYGITAGLWMVAPLVFAQATSTGLVPCGGTGQEPCNYNDFWTLLNNVLNFGITYIVIPILVILIIVGGFQMMTAAGNETQFKKGQDMIKGVVWGFAFAFLAWAVVKTVLYFLGV